MSDIKLFRISPTGASELPGSAVAVERSIQQLIEKHLDTLLGVKYLSSEYSTGKTHSGRIDTLGIDENGCPVIIEYKRALNENVINQGLFYLDWLMDHRAEFKLLVLERLAKETADSIEWSSPRLLCIAGDFNRYDAHAVQQMNRNIELIRYRRYGDELLLLELVNATTAQPDRPLDGGTSKGAKGAYKTVTEYFEQAKPELRDLFEGLKAFLLALGDDVQMKTLKQYFAFKRFSNFACVEVHPNAGKLLVFVKVDPDACDIAHGFTRDVRKIGHFGTGDLEITIASANDFERAKSLLLKSYESS
jgi:predicted transport protein